MISFSTTNLKNTTISPKSLSPNSDQHQLTDFQRTTDPYIYFASDSLGFDETVEKVELNSNGKFTFHIQKKSQATSWATPQAILEAAFKKK